jgi:AraC-like DNA-binding protein
MATRMLQAGDLSIQEVAARVGFDDPLYFSRVFKSVLGFPPSRLR